MCYLIKKYIVYFITFYLLNKNIIYTFIVIWIIFKNNLIILLNKYYKNKIRI
jgi:hypothetical protein